MSGELADVLFEEDGARQATDTDGDGEREADDVEVDQPSTGPVA
jgi:hypothetical protein